MNFHLEICPPPLGGVIFRVWRGLKYELYLGLFVGNEFRLQMWTNIIPTNLHQGETAHQTTVKKVLPPAVNWHFWPWCNYGCKFCFARFEDIPLADRLPREITLLVPAMLKQAGAEKITFVGGEPTLCPFLDELLIESKRVGLTTCIVSNASGLTEDFLHANANLSIGSVFQLMLQTILCMPRLAVASVLISSERVATILLRHERLGFDVSSMESV